MKTDNTARIILGLVYLVGLIGLLLTLPSCGKAVYKTVNNEIHYPQ